MALFSVRVPSRRRSVSRIIWTWSTSAPRDFEADGFYFDQAVKIIERERGNGPLFLYVYNVANHFPWDTRLLPTYAGMA